MAEKTTTKGRGIKRVISLFLALTLVGGMILCIPFSAGAAQKAGVIDRNPYFFHPGRDSENEAMDSEYIVREHSYQGVPENPNDPDTRDGSNGFFRTWRRYLVRQGSNQRNMVISYKLPLWRGAERAFVFLSGMSPFEVYLYKDGTFDKDKGGEDQGRVHLDSTGKNPVNEDGYPVRGADKKQLQTQPNRSLTLEISQAIDTPENKAEGFAGDGFAYVQIVGIADMVRNVDDDDKPVNDQNGNPLLDSDGKPQFREREETFVLGRVMYATEEYGPRLDYSVLAQGLITETQQRSGEWLGYMPWWTSSVDPNNPDMGCASAFGEEQHGRVWVDQVYNSVIYEFPLNVAKEPGKKQHLTLTVGGTRAAVFVSGNRWFDDSKRAANEPQLFMIDGSHMYKAGQDAGFDQMSDPRLPDLTKDVGQYQDTWSRNDYVDSRGRFEIVGGNTNIFMGKPWTQEDMERGSYIPGLRDPNWAAYPVDVRVDVTPYIDAGLRSVFVRIGNRFGIALGTGTNAGTIVARSNELWPGMEGFSGALFRFETFTEGNEMRGRELEGFNLSSRIIRDLKPVADDSARLRQINYARWLPFKTAYEQMRASYTSFMSSEEDSSFITRDAQSVWANATKVYNEWPQLEWFVDFVNENGNNVASRQVKFGTRMTKSQLPRGPAKAGHTFVRWNPDPSVTAVTGNMRCVPVYTRSRYTVKFSGASGIKNQNILFNNRASSPKTPRKARNTFIGWYTSKKFTKKFNFRSTRINKNMTLYARFAPNSTAPRSVKAAKAQKGKATISWRAAKGFTFQVQQVNNKGRNVGKARTVKTNRITVNKLKKGTHYFRVRVSAIDGTKFNGAYTRPVRVNVR
ncbi:MAG: InlB B-repeat-containing protein [Oscillospiraceae bacterium]|nr:InlB B-repeat-containing protein [Oscillospiraceae bacterium]